MKEISVEKFIDQLDRFKADGINYNVKFLSPKKELLALNNNSIYVENPDFYVLVDFVETEVGSPITVGELIDKFCNLGEDYYHTFIDFLQPDNQSMIINENSIYVSDDGYLVIQFYQYTTRN